MLSRGRCMECSCVYLRASLLIQFIKHHDLRGPLKWMSTWPIGVAFWNESRIICSVFLGILTFCKVAQNDSCEKDSSFSRVGSWSLCIVCLTKRNSNRSHISLSTCNCAVVDAFSVPFKFTLAMNTFWHIQ